MPMVTLSIAGQERVNLRTLPPKHLLASSDENQLLLRTESFRGRFDFPFLIRVSVCDCVRAEQGGECHNLPGSANTKLTSTKFTDF